MPPLLSRRDRRRSIPPCDARKEATMKLDHFDPPGNIDDFGTNPGLKAA